MARTWCGAVTLLALASLIGCKSETTEPPIQSTLLSKKETKQDKPTTTTSIDKKKDEPVAKAKDKDKKQLVAGVDLSPEEEQFIALVHAARDNAKLQRLNPHPALFRAAKAHAAENAKNKALDDDVDTPGYEYQKHSAGVGSTNQFDASRVLDGEEKEAEYQDFGFGVSHDAASGKIYWVRIFAKPK
jgi:uncharacterized protein YkwD